MLSVLRVRRCETDRLKTWGFCLVLEDSVSHCAFIIEMGCRCLHWLTTMFEFIQVVHCEFFSRNLCLVQPVFHAVDRFQRFIVPDVVENQFSGGTGV